MNGDQPKRFGSVDQASLDDASTTLRKPLFSTLEEVAAANRIAGDDPIGHMTVPMPEDQTDHQ